MFPLAEPPWVETGGDPTSKGVMLGKMFQQPKFPLPLKVIQKLLSICLGQFKISLDLASMFYLFIKTETGGKNTVGSSDLISVIMELVVD